MVEGMLKLHGSDHCIIQNCEVVYGSIEGGDPSLNWGIALHGGDGGSEYNIVRNNYVHDMRDSGNRGHNSACIMVFGNCDNNTIEHNTADASNGIVYSAFGQKAGQMNHNIWRYNIAQNAVAGFLGMASTDETKPSEDNIYYQNIAVNCESAFSINHMCYRFIIYNNIAYESKNFLAAWQTTEDFQLWNNIFVGLGNGIAIGSSEADPIAMVEYSDYNNFYGYSPFSKYLWATWAVDLNEWKQKTSQDTYSIESDPEFADPPSDFRLHQNGA